MVSMSGNSGPRFVWSLQRVRSQLLEQEAQKSEQSTPERVRAEAGETPVRRRGRVSLRAGASEQDPADGAEAGNPDEEEEEAAASGGEVGWSHLLHRSPLELLQAVFTLSPNAVKVEQLAGEIESMRAELVQKVLEGLRGDAYLVAQDLGVSKLMEDDGIDQLITALKKMIFPLQALEAKELFRVGQQVAGPLARQTGESVTSYISRRRRWWRQVQELDSSMVISDGMRAELLIEAAGLSKQEQLMVRTAARTPSFDAYAAVLLEHHGKIHLKDSRSLAPQQKTTSYGKGRGGGRNWSYQRVANWADADPEESWEDGQHDNWDGDSYNEWKSSLRMRTLPLHCWLWLSVTMTRHQQKGWMNLQVQPTALCGLHGRWHPQGQEQGQRKTFWERQEQGQRLCVLDEVQQNTSIQVDFSTAQMRAQEWTVTVYEYINEEWTRVTDRVGCTEIPEWNQESQTRILVFAPSDAVTKDEAEAEVPGEIPPDGGGDDADDHPPDVEEKAVKKKNMRRFQKRPNQRNLSWILRKLGMRPRTICQ